MTTPTEPMSAEIKAIQHAYTALNRNDIVGFMSLFSPDVERFESFGVPQARTYQGFEAVKAHVESGRSTWAEGKCEPKAFRVSGDWVFVYVHVRVRLKIETDWREGDVVDVFRYRDGKATRFASFVDETAAFEWAGVKASETH